MLALQDIVLQQNYGSGLCILHSHGLAWAMSQMYLTNPWQGARGCDRSCHSDHRGW